MPNLCFEAPGRKSAKKAPKVTFSRQSVLFAPNSFFLQKGDFGAQKSILGDSGGISPNLSKELLLFRAFSGFGRFRDAKITFS